MANENKRKMSKLAKILTATGGLLAVGGITLTVCLFYFQRIDKEKVCLYQEGKEVDKLDVTINVIPGTTQSYDVALRTKMSGGYNVCARFEGSPNSLSNLVDCSISPSTEKWTYSLSELFASKYVYICFADLSNDKDFTFTVSYSFSPSIEESTIVPIDFDLSFTISTTNIYETK